MIVVDASAFVDLLLGSAKVEAAIGGDLHAPHVVDLEVLSVLRRIGVPAIVHDFLDLTVERYPHTILAPRIWDLRDNFSPYDASYVALAEGLDVPLLTADKRLANAVNKRTDIEVLLAA